MPIAKEIAFTVKFAFTQEELTLSALSSRVGRGSRKMAIKNDGGDFAISYNSRYMLDCINSIDSDVVIFEPMSAVKATRITSTEDETHINIIMPVRTA